MDPANYLQEEHWKLANNLDLYRPGVIEYLKLDFAYQIIEATNPERPGESSTSDQLKVTVIPQPRSSFLKPAQQQQYMKLIKRFRYVNRFDPKMIPKDKKDLKTYSEIRQQVLCEQIEYQQYAFENAKENIWLFNHVPNLVDQYVSSWLKRCMKDVNELDSTFGCKVVFPGLTLGLPILKSMPPVVFDHQQGLKFIGKQKLIDMNDIKFLPIQMQKIPTKRKFKKPRKRLEDDPNVEKLLRHWKADIVVSLSTLKLIMQTSEKWEWEVPIKVKSCKHDGEEEPRRVTFIGKPLPPKSLNGRQMNDLYFKALTKILLEDYKHDEVPPEGGQVTIQQVDGMDDSSSEEETVKEAASSSTTNNDKLSRWTASLSEKRKPAADQAESRLDTRKENGNDSEFSYYSSDDDNLVIDEGPSPSKAAPKIQQKNKADPEKVTSSNVPENEAAAINLTPAPINLNAENKETETADVEKSLDLRTKAVVDDPYRSSVSTTKVTGKRHAIPPMLHNKQALMGSSAFNPRLSTTVLPHVPSIALQRVNLQPSLAPTSTVKTAHTAQPRIWNPSSIQQQPLQLTHNRNIHSYPLMQSLSSAYQRSQTPQPTSAAYAVSQRTTSHAKQSPAAQRRSVESIVSQIAQKSSEQNLLSPYQRSETYTQTQNTPYAVPQSSLTHSTQSPVVQRPSVESITSASVQGSLMQSCPSQYQSSQTYTSPQIASYAHPQYPTTQSASPFVGRPTTEKNMSPLIQSYPLRPNLLPVFQRSKSYTELQNKPISSRPMTQSTSASRAAIGIERPSVTPNTLSNQSCSIQNNTPTHSQTQRLITVQLTPTPCAGRGQVTQAPSVFQNSPRPQQSFQRHSVAQILSTPFRSNKICDNTFRPVSAQNNNRTTALHRPENVMQNRQVVRNPAINPNATGHHSATQNASNSTLVENLPVSAAPTQPNTDILGGILNNLVDPTAIVDKNADKDYQSFSARNNEEDPSRLQSLDPKTESDELIDLVELDHNGTPYAYSLWTLGKTNILIRSKLHARMVLRGPEKANIPRNCVFRTKVEYQSNLGYEKLTNFESCSDWLDITVRPKPAAVIRYHVCAATKTLLTRVEVHKLQVPLHSKPGEFDPIVATYRLSEILNWMVEKVASESKIKVALLSRDNYLQGRVMLKFSTDDVPITSKDTTYNVQQHYCNPGRFINSTPGAFPYAQLTPERQVPSMYGQIPMTFGWISKNDHTKSKKKKNKNKKKNKKNYNNAKYNHN